MSASMLPTNISIFNLDKSSLRAFAQVHVARVAAQGAQSDDFETEQGTHLLGHLLLRPELRRHPNDSSLRFPLTGVRCWRCFWTDSRRNITHYCRIRVLLCPII